MAQTGPLQQLPLQQVGSPCVWLQGCDESARTLIGTCGLSTGAAMHVPVQLTAAC
jgi:hypothetical protein